MSLQHTTKIVISSRALLQYFDPFYGLVHWKITNLISLKKKYYFWRFCSCDSYTIDFPWDNLPRFPLPRNFVTRWFSCCHLEFLWILLFFLEKDFDLQVQWWIKLIGMSQGIQMEHPGWQARKNLLCWCQACTNEH